MAGLLEGIRIVDLTRIVSGPHCTMMLAEMGAEVIKIEKPLTGDDNRQNGPWKDDDSLLFSACNISKKGISLDLRSDEGKEILIKLIEKSDVLVENFRPGTMKKMGFDYERVKRINPQIIMAAISGFGQTGPYRDRICFDGIAQAMGGLIDSIWESGGVRCTTGGNLADVFTGVHAALAIGMALYNREKTQKGTYIDIDMVSTILSLFSAKVANYTANGIVHTNIGYGPVANYKTTDGYVRIDATTAAIFKRLQAIIPDPILKDPKYMNVKERLADNDLLVGIIQKWIDGKTTAEVDKVFNEAGIAIGVIQDIEMISHDVHLNERQQLISVPVNEQGEELPFSAIPFRFSSHAMKYDKAPSIGEHNEEIFKNLLQMSEDELEQLRLKKVI
ncbi:CoA transferase|uniref:CoA:oxalate CoA-transferase n=1 Tax=Dendrosporobacter quercicolus TaxID=146817 RepID=A0A1G9SMW9_9FIRM|nr:CoA transferase [Dendrosporobacter quercicolus]NSL48667.1 CoA transferase [Dendrosporobacter quercicolus DSM 1736]SDM36789.1 CoA:oxalate CoA-transferase [Dendrosporobacter quercicolus]